MAKIQKILDTEQNYGTLRYMDFRRSNTIRTKLCKYRLYTIYYKKQRLVYRISLLECIHRAEQFSYDLGFKQDYQVFLSMYIPVYERAKGTVYNKAKPCSRLKQNGFPISITATIYRLKYLQADSNLYHQLQLTNKLSHYHAEYLTIIPLLETKYNKKLQFETACICSRGVS